MLEATLEVAEHIVSVLVDQTHVRAGDWIRWKRGLFKGSLAYVLDPQTFILAAVEDPETGRGKPPPPGAMADCCIHRKYPKRLKRKQYPPVHPTRAEIAHFQCAALFEMQKSVFLGDTCFGLGAGDRAVCVEGPHKGLVGWILWVELYRKNDLAWHRAVLVPSLLPEDVNEGTVIHLAQLRRHVLDPGPPVRLLDRVKVEYAATEFRKRCGRVVEIAGHEITIELPHDEDIADLKAIKKNLVTGGYRFTAKLIHLIRLFLCGDLVEVVAGPYKGSRGFIVDQDENGGILQVFDDRQKEQGVQSSAGRIVGFFLGRSSLIASS